MKYALIIPDGCADEPQAELGGLTPLQKAHVPNMDRVAREGLIGRADNVPIDMPPGSDVGTMSLFGYDPRQYHTGRAPIEAAAQGIRLEDGDWAIRCNLVTIVNDVMVSFTAGQIPGALGRELIDLLQQDVADDPRWQYFAGVSYRNLLIYRAAGASAPFSTQTQTVPPHDLIDQTILDALPKGPGADVLKQLMQRSVAVFKKSAGNQARQKQGDLPATQTWLWGLGQAPHMKPFQERFGKTGAVVTAVDLLRGLGRLLGWRIVDVPGATGYLDTDYAAKGRYAIGALDDVDLVVVHVEATDEASHEGDARAKVTALERIDADIVGPVYEHLKQQGAYRLLVSPDHPTFLRTRTHSHGYVPFAVCGTGIDADKADRYDELTAARSPIALAGHELMPRFLGDARRGF